METSQLLRNSSDNFSIHLFIGHEHQKAMDDASKGSQIRDKF